MTRSDWLNLLGYEATWFVTVAAAGSGRNWPGLVAVAAFAAWQIGTSPSPRTDAELAAGVAAIGFGVDSIFVQSGIMHFSTTQTWPGLPPVWMIALWIALALTLNHSLAWLQRHIWLAALFGAIGAPLAYWGAQRGWNAVTLATPIVPALLMIGGLWAVLMPVFCVAARHLRLARGGDVAMHGSR